MELKLSFDGYVGDIELKVATNIERLEAMEKLDIDIMKLSQSSQDDGIANEFMTMKNIISLLKMSESYYLKVDLTRSDDGKEFKSFDDLNNDPKCQGILMENATKCLLGLGDEMTKK